MLGVIDLNYSSDQIFEENNILRRVVMGVGMEVVISVGLFPIHLIRERSTLLSGELEIKKGNGFIMFFLQIGDGQIADYVFKVI